MVSPDFSPPTWKGVALQVAERCLNAVILALRCHPERSEGSRSAGSG